MKIMKEDDFWKDAEGYMYSGNRTVRSGHVPSKFGRGNPFTIYNIQRYLLINDIYYELLSTEFEGAIRKLNWKCEEGHIYQATWANFNHGRRCPICRGGSLKGNDFFKRQVFKEVGDEYIFQEEYINDSTPITVMHNECKREYKVNPSNFLQGQRCNECRLENWSGENNPNYNSHLTDEDRSANRYALFGKCSRIWAREVYKKDSYKCVICGSGENIQAHHLESWNSNKELRFDIQNGITMCEIHHREFHKTHGYGFNTRKQFESFIKYKKILHV